MACAELLASTGADYLVTDLQHGAASEGDLPGLTGTVAALGVTPLVRVRHAGVAEIGRALDLGAHGVFIPNVRGLEHVREVVSYCRYGPEGVRSYGRLVGGSDEPACILVLETSQALTDLPAIVEVDGVDGIYVGPRDLALSLGRGGPGDSSYMNDVVAGIVTTCVDAGTPVGVHASFGEQASGYREMGATILTAAADTAVLAAALDAQLTAVRSTGGKQNL